MATNESPTVLIVDDDRAVQRLLADALAKQGFAVAVERDGEWAVDTFNKRQVDAILLDLLLPAINGYEVARIIRSTPRGRNTPIIMISGVYRSAVHQREAVEKHGAIAFLEKPIRLSSLYETLRSALGDRYPRAPEPAARSPSDGEKAERLADPQAQEEVGLVEQHSRASLPLQGARGDFRQRPFPEVLSEIFQWKGTGALLLRRDKIKKIVYFKDGQPRSIKSNLLSECLGWVMVRERIISEAECEESTRRMKASGRRQGAVLIEMGSISPHNLAYALNLQLRIKLFEVFAWEAGEYQFNPRISPPPETISLEMSTAAVIYEGVRRHFDVGRMRKLLGSADDLFVQRSPGAVAGLDSELGEEELQLLQAIDGLRTVADLRALELLSPLDTDRFVYALSCAGVLHLTPDPARDPTAVSLEPVLSDRAGSASTPPASGADGPLIDPAELPTEVKGDWENRVGEIGLAEAKFQLGEELLRERQYRAAHQLFQEAVQIYGQAGQFHAYLGWTLFQMEPDNPASVDSALSSLEKAISLNPAVDKSYLFSGYIYKAVGKLEEAEVSFEKAIQCNPDCTEALEELKALGQSRR